MDCEICSKCKGEKRPPDVLNFFAARCECDLEQEKQARKENFENPYKSIEAFKKELKQLGERSVV